jgi:hypothetical protein
MRVAGVRCTKDKLDWAIVDGDDRTSAAVIEQVLVNVSSGDRGDGLAMSARRSWSISTGSPSAASPSASPKPADQH